jgi:hypothetical protein
MTSGSKAGRAERCAFGLEQAHGVDGASVRDIPHKILHLAAAQRIAAELAQGDPSRAQRLFVGNRLRWRVIDRLTGEDDPYASRAHPWAVFDPKDSRQSDGYPCLLESFSTGGRGQVLARLCPPGGQIPELSVFPLVNEEETIAPAYDHEGEEPGWDWLSGDIKPRFRDPRRELRVILADCIRYERTLARRKREYPNFFRDGAPLWCARKVEVKGNWSWVLDLADRSIVCPSCRSDRFENISAAIEIAGIRRQQHGAAQSRRVGETAEHLPRCVALEEAYRIARPEWGDFRDGRESGPGLAHAEPAIRRGQGSNWRSHSFNCLVTSVG